MKKLLKTVMLTQLNTKYPRIKNIFREGSTNNLLINVDFPSYLIKRGKKELVIEKKYVFKIECVSPKDKFEPYTEETLQKAMKEFPILFDNEISDIKQIPGFISFSTYNTSITKDELDNDIDHVFNYSIYNIENDPVKNLVGIKTLKHSPVLPKISKKKRDKLF
jgi:hypothetical protein